MSEAYLMSMPVIINCLGGEMIYILCSRLKAQSISEEKSIRVIKDIGNLLYNKKFQNDLYIHKKPNKHQEVKSIFETLAHSSIMRLNSTSMNKLFELMLMTLKLQLLRTRYPEEIYQIVLNHFSCVEEIIKMIDPNDNNLINMVNNSKDNFMNVYGKLNPYDYIILKSVVLRFLQGKNVKVSIFIQENLQDSNSILYLPMNEVSPPFVGKVGKVKDRIKNTEENFVLKLSKCYSENKNMDRMDNFSTDFGKNMFGTNSLHFVGRVKKKNKQAEEEKNPNKVYDAAPIPGSFGINDQGKDKEYHFKFDKETIETKKKEIKDSIFVDNYNEAYIFSSEQKNIISQGYKKDLNLFSSVFAENDSNNGEIFEFDLFGEDEKKNEKKTEEDFINIKTKNNNIKNKVNEQFGNLDKKEDDEDDLLDLMDKNA